MARSRNTDHHYRMSPVELMSKLQKRGWFQGDSWAPWRTVMKAAYGIPLSETERELFSQIAGGRRPPTRQVRALVIIKGRRAGGSAFVAFDGFYAATCGNYRLAPGETGIVSIIACNRQQARVIFKYIEAFFESAPFSELVERKTLESIYLRNNIAIEIKTASFKTIRGVTSVRGIGDEVAFWSVDGANPDVEIVNAWVPSMATIPQGMLILSSSPYARRGAMWSYYEKHFGKDSDDTLVIQGPSRVMNPLLPESIGAQAYADDPAVAAAEYGATFRSDIESYIKREAVQACVIPGRYELPPISDVCYHAGFDAAGGSGSDEQTLAISHSEFRDGRWTHVLDFITSVKPPFSPQEVVEQFCLILKRYGITRVHGDRYAGEWPREQFVKHEIEYVLTDKAKSDLYRELLPFINSGSVELLDNAKLVNQLVSLERRTARGGKDSIDHPPNGHDDLINAAAIALVTTARIVALPPLQFLDTHVVRTAEEVLEAEAHEYEWQRENGVEWLQEQVRRQDGCYFPGD
jgi:hypothetical protein